MENYNLSFGQALEEVKNGKLITRKGWNGKGMFVFMRPACDLQTKVVTEKVESLPDSFKSWVENNILESDTPIHFQEYLCMKDAKNNIVNGWLASQTDMLANDWEVVVL